MTMKPIAVWAILFALSACAGSTEPAAPAAPAPAPTQQPAAAPAASGIVGDWAVRVVHVDPVNVEPLTPVAGVAYTGLQVTISATYRGEGEGNIDINDLKYVGSDRRVYSSFDTRQPSPRDRVNWADSIKVVAGGTTTHTRAIAVPTDAISNEWFVFDFWRIPGEDGDLRLAIDLP